MHQVVRNGDNQGLLMGACRRWGEPSLLVVGVARQACFSRL